MEDQFLRLTIAYALSGVLVAAFLGWYVLSRKRAYWKRLRQKGDPRAKVRDLKRRNTDR
jgi:hypothetical protein